VCKKVPNELVIIISNKNKMEDRRFILHRIVEKRNPYMQKKEEEGNWLVFHVILKEEGKKVILKFERVIPSHTSQIGWNKN
jgi:hypothetical protein